MEAVIAGGLPDLDAVTRSDKLRHRSSRLSLTLVLTKSVKEIFSFEIFLCPDSPPVNSNEVARLLLPQ